MASGTTVFQSAVTATPPAGLPIMADSVNDTDHGVGTAQYIKIMDGRTAGTIKAAVTASGIEADVTRVQGTVQVLGSVQGVGTFHIGSVQRVGGGTIDQLNGTVRGTVSIVGTISGGTVTALAGGFGSYFGTAFTAGVALGTLIAPPASGTRWRLFDLTISASAAGTVLIQEAATATNGTVVYGPLFFAANGGMVQASARGIPARVTAQGLFASVSAGTVAITANYTLET